MRHRFGCTSSWWQFAKGLYELGHEVIAVPYFGAAIESPWWRTYANPCRFEGQAFAYLKRWTGKAATPTEGGWAAKINKTLIDAWIRPRWESHLARILERERDVDAVILFTVPLGHLRGVPTRLRKKYNVPFFYFDGDVPVSLPRFGGFASGFRVYDGADPTEYDGFMCNSLGGADELKAMGAKRVETVYWGVDPDLYTPISVEQDRDVFFYGLGAEYRENWIRDMLAEPKFALPELAFAVGGSGFADALGPVPCIGDLSTGALRKECGRSRINLNITREAHASVYASATTRIFELASMGCCIVSNPVEGMGEWFEEGEQLITVHNAREAERTYTKLLGDPDRRRAMGESARARVIERHTHRDRAERIARFVSA
jgi:glycosyltransferase involved in cell wall biosynthesis